MIAADPVALYTAVTHARHLLRKRQAPREAALAGCQHAGLSARLHADRVARLATDAERACAEARIALSTAAAARR